MNRVTGCQNHLFLLHFLHMQELHQALNLWPVVYIARDIERALSLPITTKGYWIITNSSPLAKELTRKHKNILIINAKEPLDTHELLEHPRTIALLKKLNARPLPTIPSAEERGRDSSSPLQRRGQEERSHSLINILVFKNTLRIEKICKEHSWRLLNPRAELANRVEQKLAQLEWLGPLKKYLPPHQVMKCKELTWPNQTSLPVLSPSSEGLRSAEARRNRPSHLQRRGQGEVSPFIVQFNHAHTGTGTILVESQKQILELQKKFPNREVRVTEFIKGPVFTNNNVVWGKQVLCGNISYQITGLAPFTFSPFATVGNDWALATKLLSNKQSKQIGHMATDIGKRLAKDGWKGLFGIDVIMHEKTKKIYLLEINARQPASTTFESQLQRSKQKIVNSKQLTTFEAHLASLLGLLPTPFPLLPITDGAQIVQRVANPSPREGREGLANNHQHPPTPLRGGIKKLQNSGLNVIEYPNKNPGEDLLRIQSNQGIMKNEKEFNEIGKKVIKYLDYK